MPDSDADAGAVVDWGTFAGFEAEAPAGEAPLAPDASIEPSAATAAEATTTPLPLESAPQPAPDPAAGKADSKSPNELAIEQVNSPEWQQERLTQLAKGFQLSDEEYAKFEENPREAIPELMAKVHLKQMFATTQMVSTMMEQMLVPVIQHQLLEHGQRQQLVSAANEMIFKPYPALRQVSPQMMQQLVSQVKASFPAGSKVDGQVALRRVAAAAYAMMGLELPAASTPAAGQPRGLPPIQPPSGGAAPRMAANKAATVDEQGTDWGGFANVDN